MTVEDQQLNKAQRFVRIVELLQNPGGVTAANLMGRFDLDDRTLRRYLADLKALGLPINDKGRGPSRQLWLDPKYQRRGVRVDLLELVSLHFGRTQFDFLEGTGFASDLEQSLETLSNLAVGVGPDVIRHMDRKFMAVPENRKDHSGQADLLDDVLTALLYQNPSRAHYARVGGRTRAYHLHPLTLATFRHGLYLFALDLEEDKIKTFAIDRFRNFERQRGAHFEYPENYHPANVVKDAFGIISGPVCEVVLRFNRRTSPYIQERIWHDSQTIEATDGGGVTLTMRLGIAHELVSWILGFGPDVEVVSPPDLVERVRRLHLDAAEGRDTLHHGRNA